MTPAQYQKNLARLRAGFELSSADAIATGGIFVQSELNKAEAKLRFPLQATTYFRDLPIQTGGGWVDTETAQFVTQHSNGSASTGMGSNDIGTIDFNRTQDVWITQGFQRSCRIPLIESLKLAQANKSPQDILDRTVKQVFQKTLDQRVYLGQFGATGLLNQVGVAHQQLANGAVSGTPSWSSKSPLDLYNDIQQMAQIGYMAGNAGSPEAIPNRILVPGTAYPALLQPMVLANGTATLQNVLEYIKANYFGKTFGVDVEIFPLPVWAETAGVGGTKRITAYRFDEDALAFGLLQDLTPQGGQLSLQDGAFVKTYIANTGVVKVYRPGLINYFDAA